MVRGSRSDQRVCGEGREGGERATNRGYTVRLNGNNRKRHNTKELMPVTHRHLYIEGILVACGAVCCNMRDMIVVMRAIVATGG